MMKPAVYTLLLISILASCTHKKYSKEAAILEGNACKRWVVSQVITESGRLIHTGKHNNDIREFCQGGHVTSWHTYDSYETVYSYKILDGNKIHYSYHSALVPDSIIELSKERFIYSTVNNLYSKNQTDVLKDEYAHSDKFIVTMTPLVSEEEEEDSDL